MNSTNVVFDILKNAPIGIKLYCDLAEEVTLSKIHFKERLITVKCEKGNEEITLNENGCLIVNKTTYPRCILFPSEGDTSWDGWQETLFKQAERKGLIIKNNDFKDKNIFLIQYDGYCWYSIDSENTIGQIDKKYLKQYGFPSAEEKKKFITEITNYYSKL